MSLLWQFLIFGLISSLEKYGEDVAKSTENPFDDFAVKGLITVLKGLKF